MLKWTLLLSHVKAALQVIHTNVLPAGTRKFNDVKKLELLGLLPISKSCVQMCKWVSPNSLKNSDSTRPGLGVCDQLSVVLSREAEHRGGI